MKIIIRRRVASAQGLEMGSYMWIGVSSSFCLDDGFMGSWVHGFTLPLTTCECMTKSVSVFLGDPPGGFHPF